MGRIGLALGLVGASLGGLFLWLYIGAKEDLRAEEVARMAAVALVERTQADMEEERRRADYLESIRIELNSELAELSNREAETITEIREVWRDRVVMQEMPISVDCVTQPLPPAVIGLLKCAGDNCTRADLQADPGGHDATL